MDRVFAAMIAGVAAVAIAAQYVVASANPDLAGPVGVVWRMLGYFTILTNLLVLGHFVAVAGGWRIGASRAGALMLWIVVVGAVYHLLLAGLWAPVGLGWWSDQGLHTAVPVLVTLWWATVAPTRGLTGQDALRWLGWPVGYCAYALVRGAATGFYPYPFLDVGTLGVQGVAVQVAMLAAAMLALGLLLVGVARLINRD